MIVDIDTWFIARNEDNSIIHHGFAAQGTDLSTGQPIIEEFENKENWIDKLNELNIDTHELI